MRVALIGATGVLGCALVPQLVQHTVVGLVHSPEKARRLFGAKIEIAECDLLAPNNAGRLSAALAGCHVVIHAATAIPSDFSRPNAMDETNRLRIEGTARLIAAALEAGASVYLQQSIAFAHPDTGEAWITEDTPLDPAYHAVIEMERQVLSIPANRMRATILRGGVFVGKNTFQDSVIARLRTGQEMVACAGRAFLPLIHVEDVASAFVAAIERAPAGSIFNIVDDPIREGEYLDRLAQAVGAPPPAHDSDAPCPPSYRVSNQAARTVLSWTPTHSLFPT